MGLLNRKKKARKPPRRRGVFIAATTAALTYFFDPDRGRSRRAQLAQRMGGLLRRLPRRASREARRVGAQAYGVKQKVATVGSEQPPESDEVLKDKVESEVFGGDKYPKGKISVNVENGTVVLRGELEEEGLISDLEQDVRKVTGVVDVQNLLHLPGQSPPNKAAAEEASKRQ